VSDADVLEEITIDELQARQARGEVTAAGLVEAYLERIESVDRRGPRLRSILEINPEAERIAADLDAERASGRVRGLLHGIPILLKDNIDTADRMQTTAGSLALLDVPVTRDAPVARRLRAAGAVILGKTNLSEWANFRSTRSSSGWSARGRQTRNPFVLDRSPGGSSSGSGVAVAANLAAAALGTETDGSIMSPSSNNGVVGIKPTVGLTSREGVVPISHSQDTVGPHARTVQDAALVLTAIAEDGVDYTAGLRPDALRGKRVGVSREIHTGYSEHTDAVFEHALDVLRECGAELLDDVRLPGHAALRGNFEDADSSSELIVLEYEMKADLARYLATRPGSPVGSLADVIRFNEDHAAQEMPYFRQERFVRCDARGDLTDGLYQRAVDYNRDFGRRFAALFEEQGLSAIVAPTNAPAWAIDLVDGDHFLGASSQVAAVCGFPLVTVPAGYAFDRLPLGLTFMGPPRTEAVLVQLAFAFERANPVRRAPRYVPSTLDLP
jgi:amidase